MLASFLYWPPLFLVLGCVPVDFPFCGLGYNHRTGSGPWSIFMLAMTVTFTIMSVSGVPRTIGILVPILFFLGLDHQPR